MRFGFLFAIAGSVLLAQAPAQKGSIEGQVVSGTTGEALRKAQVTVRSVDQRRSSTYGALTDAGGNFTVRDLEKGTYRLSVERTGYVRADYGGRTSGGRGSSSGTITVDTGQKITGLIMKMSPQAVITGRVLDPDGDPVTHANVTALKYSYQRGKRMLTPAGSASTDDQGEYRIHSLQPGKYHVSATWQPSGMFGGGRFGPGGPGGGGQLQPNQEVFAPTYYPRTVDVSAAVALDAGPGAVLRNIDILLSKVRTVQVSGKIVDPSGGGGRNLNVMAIPRDSPTGMMGGRSASQVQDGKFLINALRPGSYILSAERWDNNRRTTARLPIEVGDSPLEGLTLILSPGLTVTGRLRIDGADPQPDLAGASVMLSAHGDTMGMGSVGGRVKSDGTFSVPNAGPDLYTVTVNGVPENCYLKAVRFGDEDALANGLNLSRGGGTPVDIVLSPTAGSVEAVVLDAKQQPAAGAFVVAVPDDSKADSQQFLKSSITDPYGRVTLKGLAPGGYKLFAWEEVEPNAWQDPDYRKQFEKSAESLSIRESSRESKQLTVIPAGDGARP